jgi:hypothetical protein
VRKSNETRSCPTADRRKSSLSRKYAVSFDIHDCAGNLKGHAPKLLLKSGSVSRQVTRAIEKTLVILRDI